MNLLLHFCLHLESSHGGFISRSETANPFPNVLYALPVFFRRLVANFFQLDGSAFLFLVLFLVIPGSIGKLTVLAASSSLSPDESELDDDEDEWLP